MFLYYKNVNDIIEISFPVIGLRPKLYCIANNVTLGIGLWKFFYEYFLYTF